VCLLGFYLMASSSWEGLVSSLAAFILTKLVLTRCLSHHVYREAT
jgi:hypothetical protein